MLNFYLRTIFILLKVIIPTCRFFQNWLSQKTITILVILVIATSCATYNMAPENFFQLLKKGNPKIGETKIYCTDKNGNEALFAATIHTAIRITKKDGTRQQFYFITAQLKDSVVTGSKSAIFNMPIKPIRISEIMKVEFDGR